MSYVANLPTSATRVFEQQPSPVKDIWIVPMADLTQFLRVAAGQQEAFGQTPVPLRKHENPNALAVAMDWTCEDWDDAQKAFRRARVTITYEERAAS